MNKKVLVLTTLIISLFSLKAFCQEETKKSGNFLEPFLRRTDELSKEDRTFLNTMSINMELTPGFYLNPNTGNETLVGQSASPIYPFSFGFVWPNYTSFAIAPSLSFFMMNHLFDNGTVYPAEIENRTSQTFNFIVNIPLYVSLFMKRGTIQLAPGFAILPRFAVLANGVGATDSGFTGSAKGDVDEINKWFWQNARFLYFSFTGCYLINLTGTVKGGPVLHAYVPLGTIISGESIQGMIISIGMRIQL